MNPLSKAFVILVTLLTVALSCFSIAVVGAQENYKKKLSDRTVENDALRAQLAAAKKDVAELSTEQRAKQTELEQAKTVVESQLVAANAAANKAQFDLNKANADLEAANAALKIATVNLDRTNQERESYSKSYIETLSRIQDAGKAMVESNARIAELNDELRRTQNDLMRFKEASVASAKQADEKSKEVSKLEAQLGTQKLPGTTTVAANQTIQGAVTSIGKASNGVTLVQINVGEKDQVLAGMEFTISRGSNYVGTMIVTSVNTDAAIGRLTNVQGAVGNGDAVYVRGYNR